MSGMTTQMTPGRLLGLPLLGLLVLTSTGCLDRHPGTATAPDAVAADADAQPSPDGSLEVMPDGGPETVDTDVGPDLGATDIPPFCPVPLITIDEGLEVIPQTRLQLRASLGTGEPIEVLWTVVDAPPNSCARFQPSATALEPRLDVNVVGTYTVQLEVKSATVPWSCEPVEATIVVVPDQPLHIQLTWDTPGDSDECDEGPETGADLDLHFAHPQGANGDDLDGDGTSDPWFEDLYDLYWFNVNPTWGSFIPGADDNPVLTRDDTSGSGPEVIQYAAPEAGLTYRVAVHTWNDHGYGPSTATLKVYVEGVEQFSASRDLAGTNVLWNVLSFEWPDPIFTFVDGLVDDYPNPLFPQ